MSMDAKAAEEYSESLGMIGAGWWRQVAWADRQGIPEALGLGTREWIEQYVGGWARLGLEDRREAAKELTAPEVEGGMGMTQSEAADVLGVSQATVSNDLSELIEPKPTQQTSESESVPELIEPAPAELVPGQVSLDDLADSFIPDEVQARHALDSVLIVKDIPHALEVVEKWAPYMTDEHRSLIEMTTRRLALAVQSSLDRKLEVVR